METEKKYKLTDEFIAIGDKKLYRIEALKDFSNVKKGDKGGFIESEDNLSQYGNCWIYGNAMVYGNAKIYGNARVYGDAMVFENAKVFADTLIYGDAKVFGNALVFDNAEVFEKARIFMNAYVFGNAKVYGNANVYGFAEIIGDVTILNNSDYIVFTNWWSSGRHFTWTRSNNMWKVGCFYGTGEELIAKAYKDSELSGREYEKAVKYVESILNDSK